MWQWFSLSRNRTKKDSGMQASPQKREDHYHLLEPYWELTSCYLGRIGIIALSMRMKAAKYKVLKQIRLRRVSWKPHCFS